MPRDELRQPLRRRSLTERLWAKRPGALATASALVLTIFVVGATWLSRVPYPLAGEPVVTVAVPPPEPLNTASMTEPQAGEAEASGDAAENGGEEPVFNVETEPPPEPAPDYSREASIVMATHRPMKPAPIAAVTETGPDGPLPRISERGKKPSDIYAQVTPTAVLTSERPKIAIILGGMGINARLTQKAIKDLPGDITFGFAPYGDNLQEQVNKARARGHEVMLQVPMEPVGYPGNNPGPKTLIADIDSASNLAALQWHMGRFAGFTGITNYMGARLLNAPEALAPLMAELKDRGLIYLEDASVPVSVAHQSAKAAGLPMRRADIVIDAEPDAARIAEALNRLEQEAAANGFAIGTGSGLEVTIDIVAEWARELQDKGILLIPVSAAYKGRMG
jgi:polysaccharide deacetylase 2 family uncharacterized protein YibQ